jgi:hypothetical protein
MSVGRIAKNTIADGAKPVCPLTCRCLAVVVTAPTVASYDWMLSVSWSSSGLRLVTGRVAFVGTMLWMPMPEIAISSRVADIGPPW